MDDETRFWITQQVAEIKYDADIKPLFRRGKILAAEKPLTLISDGARKLSCSLQKGISNSYITTDKAYPTDTGTG